jgi:hypothetical protein
MGKFRFRNSPFPLSLVQKRISPSDFRSFQDFPIRAICVICGSISGVPDSRVRAKTPKSMKVRRLFRFPLNPWLYG